MSTNAASDTSAISYSHKGFPPLAAALCRLAGASPVSDPTEASIPPLPLKSPAKGIRQPEIKSDLTVMMLLVASRIIRGHFRLLLRSLNTYEAKLAALIALHAFHPEAIPLRQLIGYTQIATDSMMDVIGVLVAEGLVRYGPQPDDNGDYFICLTAEGHSFVKQTIRPLLEHLKNCLTDMAPPEHQALVCACVRVFQHVNAVPKGDLSHLIDNTTKHPAGC